MRQDILSDRQSYAALMLEHLPVQVALYDAKSLCLLEANKLYLDALEAVKPPYLERDELIGHSLTQWEQNDQTRMIIDLFRNVAETGETYHGDAMPFVCPNGETSYWNWTLEPLQSEDGSVGYILQTCIDVTLQIRAHQDSEKHQQILKKLRAENRRLEVVEIIARSIDATQENDPLDINKISKIAVEAIYNHLLPMAVCLYTVDPGPRVFRLLNSKKPSQTKCQGAQRIPYEHPLFHERLIQPDEPEPFTLENIPLAVQQGLIASDSFPATSAAQALICIPLWSGDYLEGMLNILFDQPIKSEELEQRALEDCARHIAFALAAARKHNAVKSEHLWLHELLRRLPESIMIVEVTSGRISYANPATESLFGLSEHNKMDGAILHHHPAARMAGTAMRNGLPIEPWNFAVIRALGGVTLHNAETQLVKQDGTTVIAHMSSAPLLISQGIAKEIAIVMQDITAQKILERQQNEFLSMVNHELRTPLTVIQGFAEILPHIIRQEQQSDSLLQTAVTNIVDQSEHLVRLIEEMLDISRIEHEQFILQRAQHNLLYTLSEVIRSQGITTKQHKIHLVLQGISHGERLIGIFDEKRIKQVLHNLIGNAIKYSPDGGEIEVGLRYAPHTPQEALIWVKDPGIGIAEEDIPHIFKRFHRVNNMERLLHLGGLGIGLYLVKEIVTRHNGHVWVESQEGVGSTFFITFPLHGVDAR